MPGKGQRSQRAKNKRKHFLRKIGQAISNLVAVLVSDLWAMAGKNGTVFEFANWPPFWMCHSDRTGCWTRVSPNRKEAISSISAQFHHMPERYERVRVGWDCAKVKGHVELNIQNPRVKTLSYDFPKLHHSNPSSFRGNVHLRQFKKGDLGHSKVTWRHTKVKVWKIEGASKVPLCPKYGAILASIHGITAF